MDESFSFLPKGFIKSHEDGLELGLEQIPKNVQNKLDNGKKLMLSEEFHVKALEQFNSDMKLAPEARAKWMRGFYEQCNEESSDSELATHGLFSNTIAVQEEANFAANNDVQEEIRSKGMVLRKKENSGVSIDEKDATLLSRKNGMFMSEARREFEEDKRNILSQVPANVKNSFRTFGFTRHNGSYFPIIELSPYDVEPQVVREQWMRMFHNTKKRKRTPTRLVFWYGNTWEDMSDAYSFVPKCNMKTLKEGINLGLDKIPKIIQEKLDSGKELTRREQFYVNALDQFTADRKLDPDDRIKWTARFDEAYVSWEQDDTSSNNIEPTGDGAGNFFEKKIEVGKGRTLAGDDERMTSSKKMKTMSNKGESAIFIDRFSPKNGIVGGEAETMECEKSNILSLVPVDVKNNFRQLGFIKWNRSYFPIIEISPYDVGPGLVRDQWMRMFHNVRKTNRNLSRLVFWYGNILEDMTSAYYFTSKTKIKSLKDGLDKGLEKIPKVIQEKLNSGKKLTQMEDFHVKALEQFNSDRELEPKDRIKWTTGFDEYCNQKSNGSALVSDEPDMLCEDSIEVEKEQSSVTDDNQDEKMKLKVLVSSKKITAKVSIREDAMISTSERGPLSKHGAVTREATNLEYELEYKKSNILSLLSADVKNSFGQLGFIKWNRYFPIIEVSPFDVIPGYVLEEWMQMFHNAKKGNRNIMRLIFWYGMNWEDFRSFSLFPDSKIKSLKDGHKIGLHKIPQVIQEKIDYGKKLTQREEFHVKALEQFNSVTELNVKERIKFTREFHEESISVESSNMKSGPEGRAEISLQEEEAEAAKEECFPLNKIEAKVSKIDTIHSPIEQEREERAKAAASETERKRKILNAHLELLCKKEQQSFDACEIEILPIIHQLRMAFNRGNKRNIEKCLRNMKHNIMKVTPSFIDAYSPEVLVKEIQDRNADIYLIAQEILKGLKDLYEKRIHQVPKGFKPIKRMRQYYFYYRRYD